MKLGYNVLTTTRSSHSKAASATSDPSAVNEPDASEPLLANNQSSNIITDYYAQTRAAFLPGGTSIGTYIGQCPSRTICSPQHPSQDLIEMLNRNQQYSLLREETRIQDKQRQQDQLRQQADADNVISGTNTESQQLIDFDMQDTTTEQIEEEFDSKTRLIDKESQTETDKCQKEKRTNSEHSEPAHKSESVSNEDLLSFDDPVSPNTNAYPKQKDTDMAHVANTTPAKDTIEKGS